VKIDMKSALVGAAVLALAFKFGGGLPVVRQVKAFAS